MARNKFFILTLVFLLFNGIFNSSIESSDDSSSSISKFSEKTDRGDDELEEFSLENDLEKESSFLNEYESFMKKRSAPRRIFIGKRLIPRYLMDERNLESLNDLIAKRNINRIFIGKRGDIKRIFIGK